MPSRRPKPPESALDEAALVAEALRGRSGAFDRLAEAYQRRAVSLARRMVGDAHDALEITQEALLRAFRNLATLSNPERFGAWFLRIVVNLSLNHRRDRAARPRRVSIEGETNGLAAAVSRALERPGDDPSRRIEIREAAVRVDAALATLTEAQQLAFVLSAVDGLPQREIATIMGCSVEAVKWHVFQARKRLRVLLSEPAEE